MNLFPTSKPSLTYVSCFVNINCKEPHKTQHFAWIDFNLSHIFKRKEATSNYMKFLTTCKWKPRFIANPGCWEKGQGMESIVDNINWRFCGGFMIGDGQSFLDLFDLYLEHFTVFMHRYRHITWEVNFWAWLEVNAGWEIVWFKADHDDSIVRIPSHLFSRCIADETGMATVRYAFPEKPGFYPSSSSYVFFEKQHILNVRYVNYKLDDYGRYHINHPNGHLETLNLRCYLTDDLREILPNPEFMWEGMIGLREYDKSITGLEDVRLFISGNQLKYVATNKSYHVMQKIRMITGDYSASMAMFENGRVLEPPTDTYCEKNWIPICKQSDDNKERFIYRWAPFEIGELEGDTLKIVKSVPVEQLITIRGSTPPQWSERDQCYYCVVHYCEHVHGAKTLAYYHMLVKLDREFVPFEWSNVFHFNRVGIQYCIGFTILDKGFAFWFSEHDGNPGFLMV